MNCSDCKYNTKEFHDWNYKLPTRRHGLICELYGLIVTRINGEPNKYPACNGYEKDNKEITNLTEIGF